MVDENKNRIQQLFLELVEISPEDRDTWFVEKGIDDRTRKELSELLQFHDKTKLPIDDGLFAITRTGDFALNGGSVSPNIKIPGYEIRSEIARGGQSIVFDAIQLSTSQRVAVKVLITAEVSSEPERIRQDREVQILASLQHPHIVGVIDRGKTESGIDYVVMPFVEGRCLDEHILYLEQDLPPSPDSNILRLFVKIAKAVGVAHEKGIVHRDLKPGNILVDQHGEPRILDFGLAKIFDGVSNSEQEQLKPLTIDGAFMGSLPWASPEQAGGELKKISPRTDVYSLGVILYQMLTGGAFPYSVVGNMMEVLDNILHSAPVPPSERGSKKNKDVKAASRSKAYPVRTQLLNPAMDAIVLKSLSKDPDSRYPNGEEFARDIERYLDGKQTEATAIRPVENDAIKSRVYNFAFPLLTIACIFLACFVAVQRFSDKLGESQYPAATNGTADSASSGNRIDSDKSEKIPQKLKTVLPQPNLGRSALVSAPSKINGVRSWTIETKSARNRLDELSLNPARRQLACFSWDGAVRIVDSETGLFLKAFVWDGTAHHTSALSPIGNLIAWKGDTDVLQVWDIENGRRLWEASCDAFFSFCPDSRTLLFANSGELKLVDPITKRLKSLPFDVDLLKSQNVDVTRFVFSDQGGLLAFPDEQGGAIVIDWQTGEEIQTLRGSTKSKGRYNCLSFSRDNSWLAAKGYDAPFYFWNLQTGDGHPLTLSKKKFRGSSIDNQTFWTKDGLALVEYLDLSFVAWNPATKAINAERSGKGDSPIEAPNLDHVFSIFGDVNSYDRQNGTEQLLLRRRSNEKYCGAFSDDGSVLAIGGTNGRFALCSLDDGSLPTQRKTSISGNIEFIFLSCTGEICAVASTKGQAVSVVDGQEVVLCDSDAGIRAMCWIGSSSDIAIITGENELQVVSAKSGVTRKQVYLPVAVKDWGLSGSRRDNDIGCSIASSGSGNALAVVGSSEKLTNSVIIVDRNSGEITRQFSLKKNEVPQTIALSSDGKKVAWILRNGTVEARSITTGELLTRYRHKAQGIDAWQHYIHCCSIAFGESGATITSVRGITAMTWSEETGEVVSTDGAQLRITTDLGVPAISCDGRIAAEFTGARIRIWNTSNGETLATLISMGESTFENWISISPDGHFVCSDGVDAEIVYVAEFASGSQSTFSPSEFEKRFNWKNDTSKAWPTIFEDNFQKLVRGPAMQAHKYEKREELGLGKILGFTEMNAWLSPKSLGSNVNSNLWEASPWVSKDGLTLLFAHHNLGFKNDIFEATRESIDQDWKIKSRLSNVNSADYEGTPAMVRGGKMLVFSSHRTGGLGNGDIYISTRDSIKDEWNEPQNATAINSPSEDIAPWVSEDGLSMIFSSNRRGGYGGFDLWATERQSLDSSWSTPVNLGRPINDQNDQKAPQALDSGILLYCSNRNNDDPGKLLAARWPFQEQENETIVEVKFPTDWIPGSGFHFHEGSNTFFFSGISEEGLGYEDLWSISGN